MRMNRMTEGDRYRWTGDNKVFAVTVPQYRFVKAKRRCEKAGVLKFWWKLRYKMMQKKYLCEIPSTVKIGAGFYIGHLGGILINKNAIIGKNVNILNGVLLGYAPDRGKGGGAPMIGDKVWIGTNAVIVGPVKIGDNVLIAPNSYVNFDVPNDSIVLGNPGRIIKNKDATKGYCNNVFEG